MNTASVASVAEQIRSGKVHFDSLEPAVQYRLDPWIPIRDGMVITYDELDELDPNKAFPDLPYVRHVIHEWLIRRITAWHKSRRMMMSWLFVWCYFWDTALKEGRRNAFQSENEKKSNELLDRAECIYEHMPASFWGGKKPRIHRTRHRLPRLEFPDLKSQIIGVAEGPDQLRQFGCSGVLMDEVQLWTKLLESYGSIKPTGEGKVKKSGIKTFGRITMLGTGLKGSEFERICHDEEIG